LPIFDGFAREHRLEQAFVQRDDARLKSRSQELEVVADVKLAYGALQLAEKTIAVQQQNATKAREELTLTQHQYALGRASFVDLSGSSAAYSQAENDRLNAEFDYYKALTVLEDAVGQILN
jgi:outer membrane protein